MQNVLNSSIEKMISIQNLSKGFERENLFEGLNLVIHPHEKIALVGKNGAGKTTFFNCLAGKENFNGRILVEGIKISLMEQEQNFSNLSISFREYLEDKKKKIEIRKVELESKMGNPDVCSDEEKFNSVLDEYNLLMSDSSFSLEQQGTKDILESLDICENLMKEQIKNLSGGQKTKLRLAECLAKKADLYLLDEPTNNLDLKTREWLENYLKDIDSLIVISHDRYFLDKVVTKVWDLENKTIKEWPLNFEKFLEEKNAYLLNLQKDYKDAMKEQRRLLDAAKARRVKASNLYNPTLAKRLERDAAKYDDWINPLDFVKEIGIDFKSRLLHNCTIFRLENVEKKFAKVLFKDVNQEIDFGEKVCVLGENGTGKSTFLKMLMNKMTPSKGEVYIMKDAKIGYFDQELENVVKELSIMEFCLRELKIDEQKVIPLLIRSGFEKESFQKKIKYFSGGEKGRLNLMRIAFEKNNVLILDEPTNNLDIYLSEALENALNNFEGTVVFVSHDRYFVDKVATRILEIKDKNITSFKGNYSDYVEESKS